MKNYDIIERAILSDGDIINPTLHLQERLAAAARQRKEEICTTAKKTGDPLSKSLPAAATKPR